MSEGAAPLIITPEVRADLHALRDAAAKVPIDVTSIKDLLTSAPGRRFHRKRMTRQTVVIPGPWQFMVTFSIETGHPVGTCRHMSMSVQREGRVPSETKSFARHPAAIWMAAVELGFSGGLETCTIWPEELMGHGVAINVVQPLRISPDTSGRAQ